MADETAVLECGACGAKLKVKAIALKVLKEIKCGKCGAKVPVKKDAPIPTDSTPIPLSSSNRPPNPPAPASAPQAARSVSAPGAASAGGDELNKARARIRELEERVASVLDQASQLTTAKARIAELELKLSAGGSPGDELKRARHEIEEQAHRISELQQLWMQKEKDTREAYDKSERANKERLIAVGDRERTIAAIKEVLTGYHVAEIEGAKKRMAELDQRIQSFLAMSRTPDAPP